MTSKMNMAGAFSISMLFIIMFTAPSCKSGQFPGQYFPEDEEAVYGRIRKEVGNNSIIVFSSYSASNYADMYRLTEVDEYTLVEKHLVYRGRFRWKVKDLEIEPDTLRIKFTDIERTLAPKCIPDASRNPNWPVLRFYFESDSGSKVVHKLLYPVGTEGTGEDGCEDQEILLRAFRD